MEAGKNPLLIFQELQAIHAEMKRADAECATALADSEQAQADLARRLAE